MLNSLNKKDITTPRFRVSYRIFQWGEEMMSAEPRPSMVVWGHAPLGNFCKFACSVLEPPK